MAVPIPTSTSSAGSAAGTAATQATVKAFFTPDEVWTAKFGLTKPPVPILICRLNPKSLKITGGGQWKRFNATKEKKDPPAQFNRPTPRKIEGLQLLFDMFEAPYGNLEWELRALEDWCKPREIITPNSHQVSAVHLRFQWGEKRWFKCYITSYSIEYTHFSKSGAPLRANVSITLEETLDEAPLQNPTSGGQGGERNHVTRAGDTLHSIAYRHYQHPRYWRGLANFNGIDDPMRLAPGSVISLPDASMIDELS